MAETETNITEYQNYNMSDNESCPSASDDEDYYASNLSDHDDVSTGHRIHPVLAKDIQLLKDHYPDVVSCRSLDEISEMDLDFSFPTSALESIFSEEDMENLIEKSVAEAWGLVPGEAVIVRLSLNQKHYFECDVVDKIDVFQRSSPKRTGTLAQIRNITEEFCRQQFRELTNEKVSEAMEGYFGHAGIKSYEVPSRREMSELLEMGFSEEFILFAYANSDGTQQGALNFLLDQQESQDSDVASAQLRSKSEAPTDPKAMPSLTRGFLAQFYSYLQKRLLTLNNYCPICDNAHHSALTIMLKPVVCTNPLCIFSFQTLGVMADAADTIRTETKVVNLLIKLTEAAVLSSRHNMILTPYPAVIDPKAANEMALHQNKKDHALLTDLLAKMPSVETMLNRGETDLKEMMNQGHVLCYPLLRWIISSNRSHIVQLPSDKQLPFMGTKHQFLMRNSPPLEDRKFRALQKKYGSVFAFHGSPIENWHSIVREGLIVASGTDKQMHGAAYGKGIYLSPDLSVSLGYCRNYQRLADSKNDGEKSKTKKSKKEKKEGSDEYLQGKSNDLRCITLCEVIDSSDTLHKHGNSNIWTCAKSEYVCTRFFFVYDKGSREPEARVNMTNAGYIAKVMAAIEAMM